MQFLILDFFDTISTFMERGGPVLNLIAILMLVKWSLVFERLWFINSTHRENVMAALAKWNARKDTDSWSARQVRAMIVSRISLEVRNTLPVIEVLVTICPLMGLIGTVTGMIDVFNVMSFTGGGDAKSMAGGVSRATIPTMAGMVGAISGLFAYNYLKSRVDRDLELLEDHLPLSH